MPTSPQSMGIVAKTDEARLPVRLTHCCLLFLPFLHTVRCRFVTKALQQSKVELTWDQTAPERLAVTNRK